MEASANDHAKTVVVLIENGADVNAQNNVRIVLTYRSGILWIDVDA